MITVHNLTKTYGKRTVLSIDQLHITQQDCIGLVGNNGAGKTTLLSLMLDLIKASAGLIKSKGTPVHETDQWKNYTGSYLDESFLIPYLTPVEFMEFVGKLHHKNAAEVNLFLNENSAFYHDEMMTKKYIRELSAGNKNKIGILVSLLSNPDMLILDEPFANLDPSSQSWLKTKLKKLNDAGSTILISSHDLKHVTEICNRIIILEEGKIVKDIHTHTETLVELEAYFQL